MATGSGKTKVMALAIAWRYFNARREQDDIAKDYAKTFLVIAPNVIVLERLKSDFANGNIFREDPIRPKEFSIFWDFDCYLKVPQKAFEILQPSSLEHLKTLRIAPPVPLLSTS